MDQLCTDPPSGHYSQCAVHCDTVFANTFATHLVVAKQMSDAIKLYDLQTGFYDL